MEFQDILEDTMRECRGEFLEYDYQGFFKIYPFTTENIDGYMHNFDVFGKKSLTVGSSGDQVINLAMRGCLDQTVIDVCPNTKFYFYLKKAGLLELDYSEFLQFFRFRNYPMLFKENSSVFSSELYDKLKNTLYDLDKDSFTFWDTLFYDVDHELLHRRLFWGDEYQNKVLCHINTYLQNPENYEQAKLAIADVDPSFIFSDLTDMRYDASNLEEYDFINLSNLGTWWSLNTTRRVVDSLSSHLKDDGNLLICYLYDTTESSPYSHDYHNIYDVSKCRLFFAPHYSYLYSFPGIDGIMKNNDYARDSVMVYQKGGKYGQNRKHYS